MIGKHHTEETKRKMSLAHKGEKSKSWKGEDIGYNGLHWWVRRNWGKADLCEECGSTEKDKLYEWANITGIYNREKENWKKMCRSCHTKFDKKGFINKPYNRWVENGRNFSKG